MNEEIPSTDLPSMSTNLPDTQQSQNRSQSANLSETIQEFYSQAVCHTFEALEHILFVGILYAIICLIVYRLIFQRWFNQRYRNYSNEKFPNCKRVLIVTAHPDDETMFFGPTILSLTRRYDCDVYLLCLSNGLSLKFVR